MGDVMVILGAGASFDCVELERVHRLGITRPPLAAQLFEEQPTFTEVLRRNPQSLSIVQRMRRLAPIGGGVEEALNKVVDRAEDLRVPLYLQDVLSLRFYLRDIILESTAPIPRATAGTTNYLDLVTRLHDYATDEGKRISFVSFNYDNLLEQAIAHRFSYQFTSTDSYLDAPMAVFKPHGSVDWVNVIPYKNNRALQTFYMSTRSIEHAEHVDTDRASSVLMVDRSKTSSGWVQPEIAVPAIAIPVTNKDAFIMPHGHEEELARRMLAVDTLLIIGWRASEASFKELARRNLRHATAQDIRSFVVDWAESREVAGKEVIANFHPHLDQGVTGVCEVGFSGFLDDQRTSPRLSEWGRFIEHIGRR